MDFYLTSYAKHKNQYHDKELTDTWKNFNTVDYWRHERMYNNILPLLSAYPSSSWLTVGDGRYGTDANFLLRHGADVLASDINDTLLKKAKNEEFINKYKTENAEALSFVDDQFDFVLCKEAYHHFPRPGLALYEMLRVAKKGVILIEPNDQSILQQYKTSPHSAFFWLQFALKQSLKKIIGKKTSSFINRYEPAGNYVYSISRREIEKVALGLNLEAIATKGINDFYLNGVEQELIEDNGPLFKKVREKIERLDQICAKRPETFGLLVAVIFKTLPNPKCLSLLHENMFEVAPLERNPYIKS